VSVKSSEGHDVRVGVVGCGQWGRNHVRTLAELGALASVTDPDAVRAGELAAEHGVPVLDLDEMLLDPGIDAVVIAAPAADHASLALRVIGAGKDVLVEKPLALTVESAEEVVSKAAVEDRILMVGHLLQYHPAFRELQRLVDDGALGQLRYLYSHRLNLGRFRREENSLWSFAPHDLSMLLALVGEEPDRVTAEGATYLTHRVPDVTTTHLRFPSGPQAHVFVSWLHPFKEQRLVVVGSDAMAVFDDLLPWSEKLRIYEHGVRWDHGEPLPVRAEATAVAMEPAEPLRIECEHFLRCVATRTVPRTDGAEAIRVLRVLAAAQTALTPDSTAHEGAAPVDSAPGPAQLVHGSAYVDAGVEIGSGTKIWHFSHVLSGSRVGSDCTIGQNVVIGPDVTIGDRCRIQNNVSVYQGVTLEDGVFCGPSCVFTNVHNPRAEVSRKDEFRATTVRRGATIGANATIVCGHEIGEFAFVGAGAVVTSDVVPHALVVGNPARQIGWMSHDGERLGDDLICPRSGRRYAVVDGALQLLDVEGS
jgi:predicted dehydrogenase/acetyltransferase-like isoleucine patch superfamily enzyme